MRLLKKIRDSDFSSTDSDEGSDKKMKKAASSMSANEAKPSNDFAAIKILSKQ